MESKDNFFSSKHTINLNGRLLNLSTPKVMGILNITPDSFFDGGKYTHNEAILNRCTQIINEGADILDLGAYSSRPGAKDVSPDEEYTRLSQALTVIRKNYPEFPVSVDTFRAQVAQKVVEEYNVNIVNDISGGTLDENMLETVTLLKVPVILMHMRGTPQSMNTFTDYNNLTKDILLFFAERLSKAKLLGITDVIIDPGFGFSKTLEQNYELLQNLDKFKILEHPLLVGVSRKSMIYKLLETTPEHALAGTVAVNTVALMKGAGILRVHDVKEAVETVKITEQLKKAEIFR